MAPLPLPFFFALVALLSGCYGTAIDTRSITADEVTISQNTPWSNLTITAKGWKSDVRGQPISPAPVGGVSAPEDVGSDDVSGAGDSFSD